MTNSEKRAIRHGVSSAAFLIEAAAKQTESLNDSVAISALRQLHLMAQRHGSSLPELVVLGLGAKAASARATILWPHPAYPWLNPNASPPSKVMGQLNYAGWITFMRAQSHPDHMLTQFERDICDTIMSRSYPPSEKQRFRLWKALSRIYDVGCGNWGRPK